jgi:hypothetical protein
MLTILTVQRVSVLVDATTDVVTATKEIPGLAVKTLALWGEGPRFDSRIFTPLVPLGAHPLVSRFGTALPFPSFG